MSKEGIRDTLQRWVFLFLNCVFRNLWIFEETPSPQSVLSRKGQINWFLLRNGLPNLRLSSTRDYYFPLPDRSHRVWSDWMHFKLPSASKMLKHSNHWKMLCDLVESLQSEFGLKILRELAETGDKNVKVEILIMMSISGLSSYSTGEIESLSKRARYRSTAMVSERTIYRAIKKLVYLGLVEYAGRPRRSRNRYRLTNSGRKMGKRLAGTLLTWSDSQTAWFLALNSEAKKLD